MTYRESVGDGVSRGDGTLGDHTGAVHKVGLDLPYAMKVEARGLVSEVVGEPHDDFVAERRFDSRTWPFPVDADDWPGEAIRCSTDPLHPEVIGNRGRSNDGGLKQGRETDEL